MDATGRHCTVEGTKCRHYEEDRCCESCTGFEYPTSFIRTNNIRPLPEGQNAAIDESLLWLQFRVRKGTNWELEFRDWLKEIQEA